MHSRVRGEEAAVDPIEPVRNDNKTEPLESAVDARS